MNIRKGERGLEDMIKIVQMLYIAFNFDST